MKIYSVNGFILIMLRRSNYLLQEIILMQSKFMNEADHTIVNKRMQRNALVQKFRPEHRQWRFPLSN